MDCIAAKNDDVKAKHFSIQKEILDEAATLKSVDTVMNRDEVYQITN